jgi:hypothetical protein
LCGITFQNKNVKAKKNSETIRRKPDQGNQITIMGLSPTKPQAAAAANITVPKKISRVNNMGKTITLIAKAVTILFVLELILPFNLTSATIAQSLKKSYSEKVEHFIFFGKIGQLAAGMTYIHVQLPLNITAIYHQSETMEVNLRKIIQTNFNSNIPQSFGKTIKNYCRIFSKAAQPQNGQF